MKKALYTIAILLITFVVFIVGFVIYLQHHSKTSLPDYTQPIVIDGLKNKVEVYRDSSGTPHIYGATDADVYYTTGYLMAQDRLWQMDLLRRVTQGKLSEIFGKEYVDIDLFMRALRIEKKSKGVFEKSNEAEQQSLHAFAKGINAYIKKNKHLLPLEFSILSYEPEEWMPEHTINLIGYMSWDLTFAYKAESIIYKITNLLGSDYASMLTPDMNNHQYPIFNNSLNDTTVADISMLDAAEKIPALGYEILCGSNNWAVAPSKSVSGKALLANDMHLNISRAPGIWYLVHQCSEEGLNVSGFALPGSPYVIVGHNESIAWGMTNVMLDDVDFYTETINPDNNKQYKFNGKWEDLVVEQYKIHTDPKDSSQFELKTIQYTHRGPIVSKFRKITDKQVSMRWIGNEYSNELRGVYELNRAKNYKDFRQATSNFIAVSQNIIYADTAGNIALQTCAGVPIRSGNRMLFAPGETDEYDWKGLVPFDSLPSAYNPSSGYLSSANNRTTSNDYPYYISCWYDFPHRFNRINEMIEAKEKLTVEDMMEIQNDHLSKLAQKYKDVIIDMVEQHNKNITANERLALDMLKAWDCIYNKEATEPLIFELFYTHFVKSVIKNKVNDELYTEIASNKLIFRTIFENTFITKKNIWCSNKNKTAEQGFADLCTSTFTEVVAMLNKRSGNNIATLKWGDDHKIQLKHPIVTKEGFISTLMNWVFDFNSELYPVDGSFHTVSPYSYNFDADFTANHGASERFVVPVGDWDNTKIRIPSGASGQNKSEFYCDQLEAYLKGTYMNFSFSKDKVQEEAKYKSISTVR